MFYISFRRPPFPVPAAPGNYKDQYLTAELELPILRVILMVNDLKCKWSTPTNHTKGSTRNLKLNVFNKKRKGGQKCYVYRCYRKLHFVHTSGTIILSEVHEGEKQNVQ